jgi:hypothetical protein
MSWRMSWMASLRSKMMGQASLGGGVRKAGRGATRERVVFGIKARVCCGVGGLFSSRCAMKL